MFYHCPFRQRTILNVAPRSWQVIAVYEQHESSPWLHELDTEVKREGESSTVLVQDALTQFQQKYHGSLMPGGSGNVMKDMVKKVEFSVREKARVQELRDKIRRSIEKLTLLTNIAVQ